MAASHGARKSRTQRFLKRVHMAYKTELTATTAAASVKLDLTNYINTLVIVHGLSGAEMVLVKIACGAGYVTYRGSTGSSIFFDAATNVTMLNLPTGSYELVKGLTTDPTGIDVIYGQYIAAK